MRRIGMATIGQAPRDDLVPFMLQMFSRPVEALQKGALDGLDRGQIESLAPDPGEVGIVSRLLDGSSTLLSHSKILPRMQIVVDSLFEQGSEFVVVLCGADWSDLKSSRLVVNPGKLFPSIVGTVAHGRRLGVIKPSAGQVEREKERYAQMDIEAVVTSASPYLGEARLSAAQDAAAYLKAGGVDLVWMSCVGMDEPMRVIVREIVDRPIILARSILSRVIDELLSGD
jgi:protein AroM